MVFSIMERKSTSTCAQILNSNLSKKSKTSCKQLSDTQSHEPLTIPTHGIQTLIITHPMLFRRKSWELIAKKKISLFLSVIKACALHDKGFELNSYEKHAMETNGK
jgi:hypothetical protein